MSDRSDADDGSDVDDDGGRDERWKRVCATFAQSETFDQLKYQICTELNARDQAHTYHVIEFDDAVRLTAKALGREDCDITDFMLYKHLASIMLVAHNMYELFLNPREPPGGVDILAGLGSLPSEFDRCAMLKYFGAEG
jgi:hypothetical protein